MKRLAVWLCCLAVFASEFEVASVKISPRAEMRDILGAAVNIGIRGGPGTTDPGRVSFERFSLKTLIATAYDIERNLVLGPDWMDATSFDIIATVPPNTDRAGMKAMLRNLLAERFKLVVRREKQELPVYVLTVARNGPKLLPGDSESSGRTGFWENGFRLMFPDGTMQGLASYLSQRMDRPVVDETGLTQHYSMTLYWMPENLPARAETAPGAAAEPAPSIFAALPQQLGLRLERGTRAVEVIVVERAERTPVEN